MNKDLPGWVDFGLLPLLNLITAFLVAGLVVWAVGESPVQAVQILVKGAFLDWNNEFGNLGYTLFYTTNFIFTGLAVAVAFHASQFNIGGEGQAYLGGLGVGLACLALDHYLPWWGILPVAILLGASFGAIWGAIPGILYAKRGAHVVITTIMFNFLSYSLMNYLINTYLKVPGNASVQSRTFEQSAWMPKLSWFDAVLPGIGNSPANLSFFIALIACVFVYVLIWRTKFGYEVRVYGANPTAARYAGISTTRVVVVIMAISGGLAGLMGLNPVMGDQTRIFLDIPQQAGFVGIAVALMGRSHPLWIVFAAFLFGMLYQGGAELAFEMPTITRDMIVVIQGLVILFAGAMEFMFRPWVARAFSMREQANG